MTTPIEDQLRDYFGEIEERSMTHGLRPATEDRAEVAPVIVLDPLGRAVPKGRNMTRNARLGMYAATLVVIAVVTVLLTRDDATETQTPAASPPATIPVEDQARAVDIARQWYESVSAGDVDALAALYAGSDGESASGNLVLGSWDAAQGVYYENLTCEYVGPGPSDGLDIACTGDRHYPVRDLLGVSPAVTTETLRVDVSDGRLAIVRGSTDEGATSFASVNSAFGDWLGDHLPDDVGAADCCSFDSLQDAIALGERRAELAEEWVAWLDENECVWDEACEVDS